MLVAFRVCFFAGVKVTSFASGGTFCFEWLFWVGDVGEVVVWGGLFRDPVANCLFCSTGYQRETSDTPLPTVVCAGWGLGFAPTGWRHNVPNPWVWPRSHFTPQSGSL